MTTDAKRTVHRRSDTGRFTTREYAVNHPKTTERERVPTTPRPSSQPRKK